MSRSPDDEAALDAEVRALLDRRLGRSPDEDDALLARVKARVMGSIGAERQVQYRTVRGAAGGWQTIAPGVERKILWTTPAEQSCMMRLAPGAVVAAHWHLADEECVVVQGSVRIGPDLELHAGDFHVGCKGSMHEATTSDSGAVVYLRGALEPSTS
jgi:quercetin dioxygenase-like cupin family protein